MSLHKSAPIFFLLTLPLIAAAQTGGAGRASNEFALDLYGALRAGKGNLFFSPYSIHAALAMTREGAAGNTRTEMDTVLHLGDADPGHGALAKAMRPRWVTDGFGEEARKVRTYELHVASGLWGQEGFSFLEPFTTRLREDYGAPLARIDFTNPAKARATLNAWVEKHTKKKIRELVPPGLPEPTTRLALANAIYFKASWLEPFEQGATRKQTFTTGDAGEVRADMMRRVASFAYHEADDLQLLELPYRGRDTTMVVLLPRAKNGLKELETKLDGEQLGAWLAALAARRVSVELPRFEFTSAFRLADTLSGLGMRDAFDPRRADFSAMTEQERLCIGAVLHKAFVAVDEKGTEAAAATMVLMKLTGGVDMSRPVQFVADHPFVFLIRHRKTGCILFLGRVTDPTR